jgi:simple sugar transport system ATP-binding protein
MNIVYGLTQPDDGKILIDDTEIAVRSPRDAINAGIGMVHQHFMLVPVFTVAENLVLGNEPIRGPGFLDHAAARRRVVELSERYGLAVDPDARVEDLPVGVQQRAEILKALLRDADVLILDEPTAVLTPQEIDDLLAVMRTLRAAGKSIVFITHKLKEVKAAADTITVLRRGRVIGTTTGDASEADLASMMVGRTVVLRVDKRPAKPGPAVLSIRSLTVRDDQNLPRVDDLSLEVRAGEIVAVAGVEGNGQTELAETLVGVRRPSAGSIQVDGRELAGRSPREILRAGVAYVPEDRQRDGLISTFSVADNLVLDQYDVPPFASGPAIKRAAVRSNGDELVASFDIRTTSVDTPAGTLSGGNQQKVVLARELSRTVRLMVASQPTRGVDVGSTESIHRRLVEARDDGVAVLIVSSELDEVLALADRIAVMYRGRLVGVLGSGASRDELGLMMAGVDPEQARAESEAHPSEVSQVGNGEEFGEPERSS